MFFSLCACVYVHMLVDSCLFWGACMLGYVLNVFKVRAGPLKPLSHEPKNAGQIWVQSAFDPDTHLSHARVNSGYNLGRTLLPTLDRIWI